MLPGLSTLEFAVDSLAVLFRRKHVPLLSPRGNLLGVVEVKRIVPIAYGFTVNSGML